MGNYHINEGTNLPDLAKYSYSYTTSEILSNEDIKAALAPSKLRLQSYLQEGGVIDAVDIDWQYSGIKINNTYVESTGHLAYLIGNISQSVDFPEEWGMRWINIPLYKYTNDGNDYKPFVDENNSTNITYFQYASEDNNYWTFTKNVNATEKYTYISSYTAGFDSLNNFKRWANPVSDVDKVINNIHKNIVLYNTTSDNSVETPFINSSNVTNINYFNVGSSENNGWSISKNTSGINGNGVGTNVWMSSYTQIFNANDVFIKWSEPVTIPFKLNGEHGQSAPTEYYEARYYASVNKPNAPTNSDGYVPDNDDVNLPWKLIPVNNDSNKVIWQTQRRVLCTIENNNIVKEYNGNWSDPIQWTGTNGTPGENAPRIVMAYKRTDSNNIDSLRLHGNILLPNDGYIWISGDHYIGDNSDGIDNGWCEHPENSSEGKEYLWMISNYYTSVDENVHNINGVFNHYTLTDNWSTPVCLTGEDGKDGEDGMDIEFIYFRTNDENKTFDNNWDNFEGDSTENDWPFVGTSYFVIDGIKTLRNQNHDTWTDNPFGVTHEYNYEYCSIRKKINDTWQSFCKPFLWSKYGEDGIDGDGVEYIFYLSPNENEVTFGDISSISNNPASWAPSQDPEYVHTDYKYPTHNPGWSDNPRGVSIHNKYEYVSIRHKRLNTNTNEMEWGKYSEPALWSRFAEDGRAISLVLESNNDMTSIGINSNHIVNNLVETDTIFSLYHNTSLVDLSSTQYYNMEIFDSNGDDYVAGWDAQNSYSYLKYNDDILARLKSNSSNNNSYEMHISIPEGFDMSNINDELRIYSKATIIDSSFDANNDVEVGTEKLITTKVKGLQLSLDDIFQIWPDRAVLKDDGSGSYPISINLQSLTSNTKIITAQAQNENKLYIVEDNNNGSKKLINVGTQEYENVENSYTYKLYYYDGDSQVNESIISHDGTFLDEENVNLVKSNETYQLIVFPQVINCSTIKTGDKITVNVLKYYENIITNITNDLGDYDLSVQYRLVPNRETGNPTYITLINEDTVDIPSLNINIATTKAVEFILVKNNETIWTQTISLIKNGEDPIYPITCELLNDNWQLAVSKDKMTVLANNRQNSYLRIYYGTTDITSLISDFTLTAINAPEFWIVQDRGGTINIDSTNNPITINLNVTSAIQLSSALNSQQNIKLKISFTYLGIRYEKEVNLSYVALAQDGENAELYEIFIENDTIKQLILEDTIVYDVTPIVKVRHIFGEESELLNVQDLTGYLLFYKVDDNNWRQTSDGTITLPQAEINNIAVRLFNVPINEINEFYSNFIDQENIVVLRDGINGTDSFAEEFIYYCPEGNTEIDWNNISDTTLDPSTWERSTSPDYIENDAWQDHPTGIDETHQYEYVAHRTWDKENEIWNNYSSPMIWSKWGHTGRDGDGVEYIYHLNNSEIFDGQNPKNWTSDENFQNTEYISTHFTFDPSTNETWNLYSNEYLTFTAKSPCTFKLTIPPGIWTNSSYFTSISYKVNDNEWQTPSLPQSQTSNFVINVSASTGDTVQWKGNINRLAYLPSWGTNFDLTDPTKQNYYTSDKEFETASYFSSFDVRNSSEDGKYEISGNIMSLLYDDDFINQTLFKDGTDYVFMYLFGKYASNNSTWSNKITDISNLILPATTLVNGCYRYMFSKNTELGYCNIILPAQKPKKRCYESMFANCTNLDGNIYIYSEGGNTDESEYWSYRMLASSTKPLNIYFYMNEVRITSKNNVLRCEDFNYFLQNNNTAQGKIIQHGSVDIKEIRDVYVNLNNSNVFGANNFEFINIESSWTDEPSGVSETNKYEWVSTRKYKEVTAEDTELINAGLSVGTKAWHPYSDPTIWAKYGEDGEPGEPGAPGASPITLDFTNDQVNFAVDDTGKIKNDDQEKTLILNILNLPDNVTISNVTYSDNYFTESENEIPDDGVPGQMSITEYGDKSKFKINVSSNSNYITFTFKCGVWDDRTDVTFKRYRYATDLIIPEGGLQVPFTVILSNNTQFTKVLNICGQHIATDGDNAITYELLPSCNSIKYSNRNYIPQTLNSSVMKYDGTKITSLDYSNYSTNLTITYLVDTTIDNTHNRRVKTNDPINLSTCNNGDPAENYILLQLRNGTSSTSTVIDNETVPIIYDGVEGETGAQGFTGPIVRMRGEWKGYARYTSYTVNNINYDDKIIPDLNINSSYWNAALRAAGISGTDWTSKVTYVNGNYPNNTSYMLSQKYCSGKTHTANNPIYNGTDPIYLDIVYYNKKYWTPNPDADLKWFNTTVTEEGTNNVGGAHGTSYLNGWASPGTGNYWMEATQFDFVATKLLYADQALINQISTHDLIATNSDGYPVAGITSGSKMYDKEGNQIESVLVTNVDGTVHLNENAINDENNNSNVRIFAGKIYSSSRNSYSLTYAPFNVRQDGTTYMSKAIVEGEITANSLKLGPGSFWTPTSDGDHTTLPDLHNNQTAQFIILTNGYIETYAETYDNYSETIVLSEGASATLENNNHRIKLKPNKLYQFISVNYQWNATEITLKLPDGLKEYYDCINDVKLYGSSIQSYIYYDSDTHYYVSDVDKDGISYYIEQQNNSLWPVKTQKVFNDNTIYRQTNSYFRTGEGVPALEQYIPENDLKGKKVSIEFSFLTYIDDNDRTSQGVKLNLGSIYWSSANSVSPVLNS